MLRSRPCQTSVISLLRRFQSHKNANHCTVKQEIYILAGRCGQAISTIGTIKLPSNKKECGAAIRSKSNKERVNLKASAYAGHAEKSARSYKSIFSMLWYLACT